MIKSSISLGRKIAILLVLSLLGLFILRATVVPSLAQGGVSGGTMQGAGAGATATHTPMVQGICGTLANVGMKLTVAAIVAGINTTTLVQAMVTGAVFSVATSVCSFYSSTIGFWKTAILSLERAGILPMGRLLFRTCGKPC